jgi:hypothetical protein
LWKEDGMTGESEPRWRKSSFSGGGGEDCVEVATLAGSRDDTQRSIAVRDSKNPNGPRLHLTASQWAGFTNEIKRGSLDV